MTESLQELATRLGVRLPGTVTAPEADGASASLLRRRSVTTREGRGTPRTSSPRRHTGGRPRQCEHPDRRPKRKRGAVVGYYCRTCETARERERYRARKRAA